MCCTVSSWRFIPLSGVCPCQALTILKPPSTGVVFGIVSYTAETYLESNEIAIRSVHYQLHQNSSGKRLLKGGVKEFRTL